MEVEDPQSTAIAFESALVVSEVRFLCDSLIELLEQSALVSRCERASTGADALLKVVQLSNNGFVLLDVSLPGGPSLATQLSSANPGVSVIALGVRETAVDVLTWAEAGNSRLCSEYVFGARPRSHDPADPAW